MKTMEEIKNDLWKRFRRDLEREVNGQVTDSTIMKLMSEGTIFIRISILSEGDPVAKVLSKADVMKEKP